MRIETHTSTDKIAINSLAVSKRYRIGVKEKSYDTFLGKILSYIKAPIENFKKLKSLSSFKENDNSNSSDIIWALKEISFKVMHGDVVGIIGSNGAGKSTMLKVLAKITEPTDGKIEINGRIASLLEVGTGFHPELTGRENVYLNGTILGMSKDEINQKFEEIIDFSGISKFIDTPVKRYSSGMKVRLAFSVAAFLEPEILLVDEVLAVGDADFQKKCINKMNTISKQGRTVLFVSHNMSAMQSLCSKAMVLENGKIVFNGNTQDAIDYYQNINSFEKENDLSWSLNDAPGNERLKILGVKISAKNGKSISVSSGIIFEFVCYTTLEKSSVDVTFLIRSHDGTLLVKAGYLISEVPDLKKGKYKVTAELAPFILNRGLYNLEVVYGLSKEKIASLKEFITFEILDAPVDHMTGGVGGILRPKIKYKSEYLNFEEKI
tara:strand:+ start:3515 stop:4822 length:1308 start_codon:yes stop_codon:yes gene_type:complete